MKYIARAFTPNGTIRMQPSKSVLHRALICAALAKGDSEILNFAVSDDISATMSSLEALGLCRIQASGSVCRVQGGLHEKGREIVDCRESGSTLRMLFPLGLNGKPHIFTGRGRLLQRPFSPFEDICRAQGIEVQKDEKGIHVDGVLRAGNFELPGDISSQFVSGLLLALPRLEGSSSITLLTPLESAPYVAITRSVQGAFGVHSAETEGGFNVPGNQEYQPHTFTAEGDFSHAAFFAVAAALGGDVTITDLNRQSLQGDKVIMDILSRVGARVTWESDESVRVCKADLQPFEMDVSQTPDLVPVLAVLACGINGTSKLTNAGRLRLKESDRLGAMQEELSVLGGNVEIDADSLVVHGTEHLVGGEVTAHGDHRIAMALCVAALLADAPVVIDDIHVVAKSAPQFLQEWDLIGGKS